MKHHNEPATWIGLEVQFLVGGGIVEVDLGSSILSSFRSKFLGKVIGCEDNGFSGLSRESDYDLVLLEML